MAKTDADKKESALAAELERVVKNATADGLTPNSLITVFSQLLGYAVANGSPDIALTQNSVNMAIEIICTTANEVFASHGAGMATQGRA